MSGFQKRFVFAPQHEKVSWNLNNVLLAFRTHFNENNEVSLAMNSIEIIKHVVLYFLSR